MIIPLDPRIQPTEMERLIEHNIVPYFELIESSTPDCREAIRRCASPSAIGGMVYDALLLECVPRGPSGPNLLV
jgi:hypothetical protein